MNNEVTAMKSSKKVSPVIIVLASILIAIDIFFLIVYCIKLFPTGGSDSIDSLVTEYQYAINHGDETLYLSLIPGCQRTREEKEYIKQHLNEYTGKDYKMTVVESKSVGWNQAMRDSADLFLLNPILSPFITDSYYVNVRVDEESSYRIMLVVYKCGGHYFINDVEI